MESGAGAQKRNEVLFDFSFQKISHSSLGAQERGWMIFSIQSEIILNQNLSFTRISRKQEIFIRDFDGPLQKAALNFRSKF